MELATAAVLAFVFSFFGFCIWVTSPRYPTRLARLRAMCGVPPEREEPPR